MKSLLELIKSLYGAKAISSTIGTRTNVIRLPSGKLQKYLSTDLNIEAASDNAAVNAYNEMKELVPEVAKMNDAERLIFEGNLRRLRNKLESSGIIPKQTVTKEAEVVSMETKEPVVGESLKKLTEEQGTINPPTTVAGRLEQSAKKLEGLGKNLEQEFSKSKRRSASEILDEYFSSYRTMQSIEDEGLVRAVARQIMYADLNAGRLKVPKEVEDTIRGMTAKDVLDDFSQWYGAAALEDLFDNAQKFYRMESPQEAIKFLKQNTSSNWENVYQPREKPIKEYMEPEEFKKMMENATINRVGIIVPKGSEKLDNATAKEIYDFYLKTGDRKLIQEEMKSISEGTKFDSFATEDRNKILDILTDVLKKLGPPAVAGGVGLEYLAEKTTPQIEGGTQQSLGLDYLTGMEPSDGYANGGRIGFKTGSGKKILDLINKVNKELKSKKSMETIDLKTGEVGPPKEPVMTAENKSRKLTKDEIADYEEAIGRDSEQWMLEGTVDEAEKALKRSKAEEAYYRTQYKLGKLDPAPGEQTEDRMKFLQKKFDQVLSTGDRRYITLEEAQELQELQFALRRKAKVSEEDMIRKKYGGVIDEALLQKILIDDNPQRKAEVMASLDEAIKMEQKGMSPQEIINIINNTTRTKQAKGGSLGLNYLMGL
jgi:hypothetical protein